MADQAGGDGTRDGEAEEVEEDGEHHARHADGLAPIVGWDGGVSGGDVRGGARGDGREARPETPRPKPETPPLVAARVDGRSDGTRGSRERRGGGGGARLATPASQARVGVRARGSARRGAGDDPGTRDDRGAPCGPRRIRRAFRTRRRDARDGRPGRHRAPHRDGRASQGDTREGFEDARARFRSGAVGTRRDAGCELRGDTSRQLGTTALPSQQSRSAHPRDISHPRHPSARRETRARPRVRPSTPPRASTRPVVPSTLERPTRVPAPRRTLPSRATSSPEQNTKSDPHPKGFSPRREASLDPDGVRIRDSRDPPSRARPRPSRAPRALHPSRRPPRRPPRLRLLRRDGVRVLPVGA